jgi:DNA-binding transcriptional ArsR family regulator
MSESALALDRTLEALADPARRRTIELLRHGPMRAGDLAREVGIGAPAMSRHLGVLRRSGIVAEEHPEFDARVRIYSLKPGPIAELKDWLALTEEMWASQLLGFKAYLETNEANDDRRLAQRLGRVPESLG